MRTFFPRHAVLVWSILQKCCYGGNVRIKGAGSTIFLDEGATSELPVTVALFNSFVKASDISDSTQDANSLTVASSRAVKSAYDLAATVQTELSSLQTQLASMRGFSKPDWIGAWKSAVASDTDITWTHNLNTEDLFYVTQLRFPNGEITQMNPMLTFPYYDVMKPSGRIPVTLLML